jgi:hypothetical protein
VLSRIASRQTPLWLLARRRGPVVVSVTVAAPSL